MKNKKIFIILASYYPSYKENSITEILNLVNKIGLPWKLILVCNSQETKLKVVKPHLQVYETIDGSNSGWEFSAWDEGLSYIAKNCAPSANDQIILVNDTFCHHRNFGFYEKFFFATAFKRLKDDTIIGEFDDIGESIRVGGYKCKHWLSTYLFSCNYKTINKLLPLDKVNHSQHSYINIKIVNDEILISNSSINLIQHLNLWLNRYKSKADLSLAGDSLINKRQKLNAIINEKLLSAIAQHKQIELKNVYINKLFRNIPKIPKFITKPVLLIKRFSFIKITK